MNKAIVVAGATGNLGKRIIKALLQRGATVHAVVRRSSDLARLKELEEMGAQVFRVDTASVEEMSSACQGAACVVSALAGLEDVIIGTQKLLLDAAVKAGVPRFIPSDFSLDFTNLQPGTNRNLDQRRSFHLYLDRAPVRATTIFNGPFMDLLTDQMPMILFKKHRVLYWAVPTR